MTNESEGSRSLHRLVAFTDASVAIALTLLALPLVDVAREVSGVPVTSVLDQHASDLTAFVLSFFVVALFWRIHQRIFSLLDESTDGLAMLNAWWLLGVVFLPVPTAVLTFGETAGAGAAAFYAVNLLYVALLGLVITLWIRAHSDLRRPDTDRTVGRQVRRGVLVCALLAVVVALTVPLGSTALALLLALPVARRVARWQADRADRRAGAG